ncbi:hypothetical protein J7400_17725 [Shimia sp. R9_2]|uniref:hypothetical protein n=1 Tax=Shimia sp. R9_2 TaxID=2821112 RepID=UPI001ADBF03D|nr:hypothetical protein [Shimia sp. R9_2]MBO9398515.1 hypothetical protein [Shimia sp. R9_2]
MTAEKTKIDHLVLCVHGIGNQVAGETVDDVLSGAMEEHNRQGQPPVVADETIVQLFETPYADYAGKSRIEEKNYPGGGAGSSTSTPIHHPESHEMPQREGTQKKFPMHVKRVRKQGAPPKEIKTVMAEVYWADLSKEPKGAFATIFDLIKVVMSVGYLALDNASNTKSHSGYSAVVWFLWALIGGVVALNAALLMGALVLLLEGSVLNFDAADSVDSGLLKNLQLACAMLAGVALFLGLYFRSRPPGDRFWTLIGILLLVLVALGSIGLFTLPSAEAVFAGTGALTIALGFVTGVRRSWWELSLWRVFSTAACAWGLLILVSVPFIPEAAEVIAYCNERAIAFCLLPQDAPPEDQQLRFFVGSLMLLLEINWAIAVLLCLVVYIAWFNDRGMIDDSAPHNRQRRMFAPICSALLLLWMLLASSVWVVTQDTVNRLGDKFPLLQKVLNEAVAPLVINMTIGLVFLALLIITAIVVMLARFMNKDVLFKTAISASWMGRLLFNWIFQVVCALSTLAFAAAVVTITMNIDVIGLEAELTKDRTLNDNGLNQTVGAEERQDRLSLSRIFVGVTHYAPAVLLGLAFLIYQLRDFVAGGLGAFRDVVVYANNNKFNPAMANDLSNFPPRLQIEGRFETVVKLMMSQLHPKRVTIISHSQGTVVATRTLRRLLPEGIFGGCEVTLVTMGSPVTHLYRKYFPDAFRIEPGDFNNDEAPIKWFNIGRTDDFVGTYIENLDELNGLAKPQQDVPSERNLLVPAGGHPGYFTDPYVWQHYTQKIGFRLL